MSFELSFAPEFFLAEGEPCDRSDLALNKAVAKYGLGTAT
jgi:hypothetical protein